METHTSARSNGLPSYEWKPGSLVEPSGSSGHACVVLNRNICIPPVLAEDIWHYAKIRCVVDGGANRWRIFLEEYCQDGEMKPPELITGDFDSITAETIEYFNDPLTQRIHTPDQNATDFTKALGILQPIMAEQQLKDVIVFHDTSGRFDQIMANINTLHKLQGPQLNIFLLSGNSITWLLRPGKHCIQVPQHLVRKRRWCSLMPIGNTASNVTTSGLQWNLSNDALKFGGMVSTSNTYVCEEVSIETNESLVWSMGFFSFDND